MSVLVTGAAGFIGFHVARALVERGASVEGVDNLNEYYDSQLKRARLAELEDFPDFRFQRVDIAERDNLADVMAGRDVKTVIHLASQVGVRSSFLDPRAHVRDNLVGQMEVLEFCRERDVQHLVQASTSAVYGANSEQTFSVDDRVDDPLSFYAATKRGGELMSRAWSSLHGLPVTSLRFFTVYGPWGRPRHGDLAVYRGDRGKTVQSGSMLVEKCGGASRSLMTS